MYKETITTGIKFKGVRMTKEDILKEMEFSSRILELVENANEFTTSDLQGCIQAVIMDAIRYGRNTK